MGVDIAGFGLIFLAMLAGFIPGIVIGIWIVSHRNYAAWKKKKKQVARQIEKSRKALAKAREKDIARQKKEFEEEQKRKRKEEKQNSELQETEYESSTDDMYPEDGTDSEEKSSSSEQANHDEDEDREISGIASGEGSTTNPGTSGRKPAWRFGRKKKKGTLLENRIQTCISDMSFECAENGTSEKEVAREYQKKQDDAYRI